MVWRWLIISWTMASYSATTCSSSIISGEILWLILEVWRGTNQWSKSRNANAKIQRMKTLSSLRILRTMKWLRQSVQMNLALSSSQLLVNLQRMSGSPRFQSTTQTCNENRVWPALHQPTKILMRHSKNFYTVNHWNWVSTMGQVRQVAIINKLLLLSALKLLRKVF